MRRKLVQAFLFSFGAILFNYSPSAEANWYNNSAFHNWYFNGGYAAYGGYGYGGFSSTGAEGYLRGMGAYYDSVGRLYVNNAIAEQHFQKAYTLYLKNEKLRLQTRLEMKAMAEKDRLAHKKPAPTKEELEKIAALNRPPRMAAGVRDATTGKMKWPRALVGDEYADLRAHIEKLYSDRAAHPNDAGLGSDNYIDIVEAADYMAEMLRDQVHLIGVGDYIKAQQFIKVLRAEGRYKPTE